VVGINEFSPLLKIINVDDLSKLERSETHSQFKTLPSRLLAVAFKRGVRYVGLGEHCQHFVVILYESLLVAEAKKLSDGVGNLQVVKKRSSLSNKILRFDQFLL
jgi:hypothetical protein